MLQRRMKLGYSRAARIIDIMEEMGIVWPADGSKPRDVMM
jgi:S-DNA-T family DNA segregation ATPase FtsK/SpoIIIE